MISLAFNKRKRIRRRSSFYLSDKLRFNIITILLAAAFLTVTWIGATHYLPRNPQLFGDYLAETIPMYNTFLPKEEDVVRDNLSLATLHYLLGINVTQPTSMIKAQIPVFNQFDYVQVITPPDPVIPEPPDEPEPVDPIEPDPTEPGNNGLQGKNILLYHSHTTEAFVPTSGIPHTEKFDETIVKVGEHLAQELRRLGANVIHDVTHHSKRHSESYRRSRETVQRHLNSDMEFDLIIDLHRDGVGQSSEIGKPVTTTTINGVQMGRLLFVVGQRHDGWRSNYVISQTLNSIAESLYPSTGQQNSGLTRGTVLKASGNYNQDLHEKMVLIEIGGHWNTLEEAINTTKPLAEIINVAIGE